MIHLRTPQQIEDIGSIHHVNCKKGIGSFEADVRYSVQLFKCHGRSYKPGKHIVNNKSEWIDKEGVLDERLMIFGQGGYAIADKDIFDESFDEI